MVRKLKIFRAAVCGFLLLAGCETASRIEEVGGREEEERPEVVVPAGPPQLLLTADSLNVEVFDNDVVVNLKVVSTVALPEAVTVTLGVDGGEEEVDFRMPEKRITVGKGAREGSVPITFRREAFVKGEAPGDVNRHIGVKVVACDRSYDWKSQTVVMNVLGGFFPRLYCQPYVNYIGSHYMKSFTIGDYTLDPEHDDGGDYYYSNDERKLGRIDVPTGVSPLVIRPWSKSGGGSGEEWIAVVWVDWNKDGDFADEGELMLQMPYVSGESGNGQELVGDLVVPESVLPGFTTIMRIGVFEKEGTKILDSGGCADVTHADLLDARIYVEQGREPVVFAGNLADETVTVDGKDAVKTLTVNFPSPLSEEAVVLVSVSGVDAEKYRLSSDRIVVPAGQAGGSATVTFLQQYYQMGLMNDEVRIEFIPENKYRYTAGRGCEAVFRVTGVGEKPYAFVEAAQTDLTVKSGADRTVSLTVRLSQPAEKELAFALRLDGAKPGMAELGSSTVRIPKGAVSGSATVTFASDYFYFREDRAEIAVVLSSDDILLDSKRSSVTFRVQGEVPRPAAVNVFLANYAGGTVDVGSGDQTVGCLYYMNVGDFSSPVSVRCTLVGESAGRAVFENGETAAVFTLDENSSKNDVHLMQYFSLTVKQSAFRPGEKFDLQVEVVGYRSNVTVNREENYVMTIPVSR